MTCLQAASAMGHALSLTAVGLEQALSPENVVNVRSIYCGLTVSSFLSA